MQDSWKVSKRLTLDLGIRITHFSPWADNLGFGFRSSITRKYSSSCTPTQYCGFLWNKTRSVGADRRLPDTRRVLPAALRHGVRSFRYRQNRSARRLGPLLLPLRPVHHRPERSAGTQTVTLTNNQGTGGNTPLLASEIDTLNFTSAALSTGAVDSKDDNDPVTDSYSFTVSQRVPGSGLVEVAYVGNQSRNLLNTSGGYGSDINLVPVGAMLSSNNNGVDPASLNANNFRPLAGFLGYQPGHQQSLRQLQFAAGEVHADQGPRRDQCQLHLRQSAGYSESHARFVQSATTITACRPPIALTSSTPLTPTTSGALFHKQVGWRSGQWLAVLRHHPDPERRQPDRATGQNFSLALNSAKIPGTTYNISSTSLLGTPNIQLNPI